VEFFRRDVLKFRTLGLEDGKMVSEPENESYEFEDRFSKLLDIAKDNIRRSNLAVQENVLPEVDRYSMPQIPVWRLHLGATATFLGIIQCLRTRQSSLGAFSLLRGLIEVWTHLYFIADESESGSSALRAIRFEAGVLSEWASVEVKMNPKANYEEIMRKDQTSIMKLWNANGGKDQPQRRTYKHVKPTLERMAKSPDLKELGLIHASSSVAVHMSASDFLLESSTSGVTVIWASEPSRCAWFQLAIMSFDNLTMSALSAIPNHENGPVILDLRTRWRQIYNDPLLVSAVASKATDSE
jgi:hypothetical protein